MCRGHCTLGHAMRTLKKVLLAATLGILVASTAACQGAPVVVPSDDHAEDVALTVYIGDNFYEPQEATIAPGQAVTWEWVGKEKHDVVANDRSFVSELQREGTYTHIFEETGDFLYICSIHPEMRGKITVSP